MRSCNWGSTENREMPRSHRSYVMRGSNPQKKLLENFEHVHRKEEGQLWVIIWLHVHEGPFHENVHAQCFVAERLEVFEEDREVFVHHFNKWRMVSSGQQQDGMFMISVWFCLSHIILGAVLVLLHQLQNQDNPLFKSPLRGRPLRASALRCAQVWDFSNALRRNIE